MRCRQNLPKFVSENDSFHLNKVLFIIIINGLLLKLVYQINTDSSFGAKICIYLQFKRSRYQKY